MAVKIKDVAKAANVSEATVSLAINNNPLVNFATKEKVLKVAKELGYMPNSMARKLAKKRSNQIGLIIPDIENVFYSSLVKYANEYCRRIGYGLTISISNNSRTEEENSIQEMIENRVEGIILVPLNVPNTNTGYLSNLELFQVPFVFAADSYAGINASSVVSDLEQGMYSLTRYIVQQGKKRLVYLTGQGNVGTLDQREKGFLSAVKESSVEIQSKIIHLGKVDYDEAYGAVCTLVEGKNIPDVIICVNDMMALGAVNALNNKGMSIPEDVSVTGCDDVVFSSVASVGITTLRQDIKALAEKSVDCLVAKITGQEVENETIVVPTELVIRESLT